MNTSVIHTSDRIAQISTCPSMLEALVRTRRTVSFFDNREVPRSALEYALELAVHAPNHFHTRPWRFTVFTGESRHLLADAYAKSARSIGWNCERARRRAYDAPVSIAIGCMADSSHPRVMPLEEEFSVAAATQLLMLGLRAHGLDSALNTSPVQVSSDVEALAGFQGGRTVGVLSVGFRDENHELLRRPRPTTDAAVHWV